MEPLKFIIHAGERKTGSTAIQHCIIESKEVLEKAGILYYCGENMSHNLLANYYQSAATTVNKDLEISELCKEVRKRAANPSIKYLLISGEELLAGEEERYNKLDLSKLVNDLLPENRTAGSIDLIVYIREPVSHYLSVLNQASKWRAILPDFNDYRKNLYQTLETISAEIGSENTHVKAFQKTNLFEGCVVRDFLKIIQGITGKNMSDCYANILESKAIHFDDYITLENVNASMLAEQFIALHFYRKTHFSNREGENLAETTHLLRMFYSANQLGCVAGSKGNLTATVIKKIKENNREEIALLEQKWDINFESKETIKIQNQKQLEVNANDPNTLIDNYDPKLVSFYQSLSYRNNTKLKQKVDWSITKSPYILNQNQFRECWARLLYLDFCYLASFQLLLSIIPSNWSKIRVWKSLYKTFVKLCLKLLLGREK